MHAILSDYDKQAAEFLERFALILTVQERTPETCPPWAGGVGKVRGGCSRCGSVHGREYLVTIARKSGEPLAFPFWGAHADRPTPSDQCRSYIFRTPKEKGRHPSAYDVLSCLSGDVSTPDTADDVVSEFGDMMPTRAEAIALWGRTVRAFFSSTERDALATIQ